MSDMMAEHPSHPEICRICGYEFCKVSRWKEGDYWHETRSCERCSSTLSSKTNTFASIPWRK